MYCVYEKLKISVQRHCTYFSYTIDLDYFSLVMRFILVWQIIGDSQLHKLARTVNIYHLCTLI
jgi:hypothetical protein